MADGHPSRLALFWQKNGWFGLIFIAAGVVLLAVAAMISASVEREFNATIETEGTVGSLYVDKPGQRLSSSHSEQTRWLLYVNFVVDGQEYTGYRGVPEEHFERIAEGDIIPVRYKPEDPYMFWVFSYTYDNWSSQLRFFGVVALIFGLFLVWGPWVVAGNELKKHRS